MRLTIISHTEHYKKSDGTIVGWGPTISELNHLANSFEEITHVAMLHSGTAPESSLPYTSSKIKFVPLPALGGKSIFSKIKIISKAPKVIAIVSKQLKNSDVFQLRTPTGIGVFLIPYLTLFVKKKGWYKYAGNWKQENPPLGYRLQRWMLKKQKRIVTVNGNWKNQPKNIIAFENPCLTENDRIEGKEVIKYKHFGNKLNYCFVGGLNDNKGIEKILDAFKGIDKTRIEAFYIVGDGVLREVIELKATEISIKTVVYGSQSKEKVNDIYKKSHFIILPSQSEGFPKVIGEAMNYGCVPIVSDVSSIGQYIQNNKNGLLINSITINEIKKNIELSVHLSNENYKEYIGKNYKLAEKFTYNYFNKRILNEIF